MLFSAESNKCWFSIQSECKKVLDEHAQMQLFMLPERFDWSIIGWTILRLAFINLSADSRSKQIGLFL